MADEGFKRKLAAILSADVEGYSRLMDDDEEATVRTLTSYRTAITDLVQQFRGRIVDTPGDNILAEFTSVVDAVNCAVEIQRDLAERNAELPDNRKMEFRIGVNLGDVIEEEGRIYGDGINIAARVESLSEAGGICISGRAYDQVANKLGLEYENLGEHQVKNISTPIRVYRVLSFPGAAARRVVQAKEVLGRRWRNLAIAAGAVVVVVAVVIAGWQYYIRQPEPVEPASLEKMKFPLPDKPSIAVLPFVNMSGDPEQEYIADGISENIITALSKTSQMFVISRNSTFTYKGKPVKVQQVSEELGVRYVLEGSIQMSGNRLRIAAQLINAIKGHHLWAEQYDRDLKDLFDTLDEITKEIVVAMQVELTDGEQARLFAKDTDNLEAWGHYNIAWAFIWKTSKEDNANARAHFEQAVKLDSNFASAWSALALTHWLDVAYGWAELPAESIKRSDELNQKAISLDESSPLAHSCLGGIYRQQGKYQKAIEEGEKAIFLAPSNAYIHFMQAITFRYARRPEEAIVLIKKAMRLDPVYPASYLYQLGLSCHQAGRYKEALEVNKQLLERNKKGEWISKRTHFCLTATYLEIGQEDEARVHFAEVLKIDPNPRFVAWVQYALDYKGKDLARFKELFRPLHDMYTESVAKKYYVHTGIPVFKFEYPEGSLPRSKMFPWDVFGMRTPVGVVFRAGVADIPEGVELVDVGPKVFLNSLKRFGSKFTVVLNVPITIDNDIKAYRTEIKWLYFDGKSKMTTILVSTYKDGKWVSLCVHTLTDPEDVVWIVESLTFQ